MHVMQKRLSRLKMCESASIVTLLGHQCWHWQEVDGSCGAVIFQWLCSSYQAPKRVVYNVVDPVVTLQFWMVSAPLFLRDLLNRRILWVLWCLKYEPFLIWAGLGNASCPLSDFEQPMLSRIMGICERLTLYVDRPLRCTDGGVLGKADQTAKLVTYPVSLIMMN